MKGRVGALIFCATALSQLHADVTTASLRAAAEYSAARRGYALAVMRHDKIIFEDYENGSTRWDSHKIYSGTKSFWIMAMLAAGNDGLLTLDERVSETIPEWREDPRKRNITLRQVMNFTDGIDAAFVLHGESVHDRDAYALRVPLVAKPGSAFIYGPSHGQIMIEVLKRKLASRDTTPYAYLVRKVLDPLGIGPVEHKEDAMGNPLVATGFKLDARQWLRFGTMLLHDGAIGKKRIVPAALLDECFHGTSANPAFGMGLWLNHDASRLSAREPDIEDELEKKWQRQEWGGVCICKAAPSDMIAAVGSGYQRLYVIPSLDLVIVRQGENAKFSDSTFLRILLDR